MVYNDWVRRSGGPRLIVLQTGQGESPPQGESPYQVLAPVSLLTSSASAHFTVQHEWEKARPDTQLTLDVQGYPSAAKEARGPWRLSTEQRVSGGPSISQRATDILGLPATSGGNRCALWRLLLWCVCVFARVLVRLIFVDREPLVFCDFCTGY